MALVQSAKGPAARLALYITAFQKQLAFLYTQFSTYDLNLGPITLGSKLMILSIKLLFFRNPLIVFHYASGYPNILTTDFITIFTASGGFGRDASQFRLAELIPDTDFLAYSRIGFTLVSSSQTDYFFVCIFCY